MRYQKITKISGVMKNLLDKIALTSFSLMAAKNGYRFKKVTDKQEIEDANRLYNEEAFSFPDNLKDQVSAYKKSATNFVAYHYGIPVGLVRLADPRVINRPYELYGVDEAGEHYEIQSLVVKKEYRDGTQFVMLGLFKAMYVHSVRHGIGSWNSCGLRNVYLTVRRFCKKIEAEEVNFAAIDNPLTRYLYANRIIDTYFTMAVSAFEPWEIFKQYVNKSLRKWSGTGTIKEMAGNALAFIKNRKLQRASWW
jgi:hypothetical protein